MTNRYSGADKQAVHNTCMTASVCPRTPHYIQHSLPEEPRLRQLSPHPSCGKSKESIPTGLKGLGLLQLITTTTISHLAFTLTNKRRIDLFRSWSCAETSSRRSFCLIVFLISPFARLSSTSWIDIIHRTASSSASIFVFRAYINDFNIRTGVNRRISTNRLPILPATRQHYLDISNPRPFVGFLST